MSTPILSETDRIAISQSFGVACGITALLLVLESMSPESRHEVKEKILTQWRGAWNETFQTRMNNYLATLGKVTNAHKLSQPEDYQQAFNQALRDAEKTARISLNMGDAT